MRGENCGAVSLLCSFICFIGAFVTCKITNNGEKSFLGFVAGDYFVELLEVKGII